TSLVIHHRASLPARIAFCNTASWSFGVGLRALRNGPTFRDAAALRGCWWKSIETSRWRCVGLLGEFQLIGRLGRRAAASRKGTHVVLLWRGSSLFPNAPGLRAAFRGPAIG